jgi:pyruvate/2-oxoglutarate dehydrogenase complex dihydrolipoamide dehydrogenase (E3) component
MSSPATENVYDVIVIGTGPIGQTVADRARAARLSVAAVEREPVGAGASRFPHPTGVVGRGR